MLRQEVEALLKMEGLEVVVYVKRWNGYHPKTPNTVGWNAYIHHGDGWIAYSENELTNHRAATVAYKAYIRHKEKNGNH